MDKIQKIYVVAFIFDSENKLLIAKRNSNNDFLGGYYELPGGKIEFGEEPKEALKRELFEELQIKTEILDIYHSFSFIFKNDTVHGVEIAYFAKLIDDKSKIVLTEHEDISWVSREELDSFKISEKEKETMLIGFEKLNN